MRSEESNEEQQKHLESAAGGSDTAAATATATATATVLTYLIWEDIKVVVVTNKLKSKNRSYRKLLNGVTGFALSSRILAIMGPSGSGKSTLLDTLAGRLSASVVMTGNVLLNGKQTSIGCKNISYTTQEDFHLGTLTVWETLKYSAHLRLPRSMSNDAIDAVVEDTIAKMGLQDCADKKVGNWLFRGISGGEKRRLSISIEMVTQPEVVFVDEPTSGLDSAAAFFIIQALKNICLDGKIVVCSIHQPSSYVFDLFDDLCLLSGGETVYFGEAKLAVKFFAESGFPCPTRRNPSDHFLQCINSDFDKVAPILWQSTGDHGTSSSSNSLRNLTAASIKATLLEKYKSSEYSVNTRKRVRQIKLINEELMAGSNDKDKNKNKNSWWKQLCTLTSRSFLNMTRDMAYYWVRILFYILISTSAGTFYFDIGLENYAFITRAKCYTYLYNFLLCLSVGGLPSFAEERKVSYYEMLNGHYGEGALLLSNFISSLPFLAITCLSSGTIIYYMVKFHLGFSYFCYFCINLFLCISIIETIAMTVALLVPTFLMGIGVSAALIMVLLMASGLYRPVGDLPRVFWYYPMTYISFTSWAVQGQYKNDMIGLEFEPILPGDDLIPGVKILQTIFGINLTISKWWDLAALLLLLVIHKLIYFLVLKHKQRSSLLDRFYAKRTLRNLAKSASFRMEKYSSSRRLKPLHPLSAQEGLSSPLP